MIRDGTCLDHIGVRCRKYWTGVGSQRQVHLILDLYEKNPTGEDTLIRDIILDNCNQMLIIFPFRNRLHFGFKCLVFGLILNKLFNITSGITQTVKSFIGDKKKRSHIYK